MKFFYLSFNLTLIFSLTIKSPRKMAGAPMWSAAETGNFHQQPPQDEPAFAGDQYNNPSLSKVRSFDLNRGLGQPTDAYQQGGQPLSIGAMTRSGEIQNQQLLAAMGELGEPYGGKPPSVGSMVRNGVNSQTGSGYVNSAAPPSLGDLGHRDGSRTGESTGAMNLPQETFVGMSFNGNTFGRVYPGVFMKEEK